jgi:hypothetical protein
MLGRLTGRVRELLGRQPGADPDSELEIACKDESNAGDGGVVLRCRVSDCQVVKLYRYGFVAGPFPWSVGDYAVFVGHLGERVPVQVLAVCSMVSVRACCLLRARCTMHGRLRRRLLSKCRAAVTDGSGGPLPSSLPVRRSAAVRPCHKCAPRCNPLRAAVQRAATRCNVVCRCR